MNILVVGRQPQVIGAAQSQLDLPGVEVFGATTGAEVSSLMRSQDITHVFMGPGLPLETRVGFIETIFEASDTTCVHMKDFSRGPEGALDFIRGIIHGLNAEYYPPNLADVHLQTLESELAAAVGLDSRQLRRYENGDSQPTLQGARALAETLGLAIDELAGGPPHFSGNWWCIWHTPKPR